METNLTEQESLKIITEMIERSKMNLRDNGFFYLLWGWLMLAALVLNFVLEVAGYERSWLPWPVLMAAGLIVTLIAGFRLGKRSRVRTYFDTAMIFLWNGFLVVLIIVLFLAGRGVITWRVSTALIISLYGLGTFVSGGLLRFRPLIFGGIFAWVMALLVPFVPGAYAFVCTALSLIVAYLLPGYILQKRYKKEGHV